MKKTAKIEPDGNSLLLRASAKRLFESLMEQTADRIYIKDKNINEKFSFYIVIVYTHMYIYTSIYIYNK